MKFHPLEEPPPRGQGLEIPREHRPVECNIRVRWVGGSAKTKTRRNFSASSAGDEDEKNSKKSKVLFHLKRHKNE